MSGRPTPEVRPAPSRVRLDPARDTAFMSLTLSFQTATVNFTASSVSLLLMTTFPLWSISAPPKPQVAS